MKRPNLLALVSCLALSSIAVAEPPANTWADRVTLSASDRVRGELVDFFEPRAGTAAAGAQRYNFFANQLRVGAKVSAPGAFFVVDIQDTRLVNLPDDASLSRKNGGNLGTGAIYFANTHQRDQGETFLKQGYFTVTDFPGLSGTALTAGRFDYSDGLETTPADAALAWLKKARISERLVGPFNFTHVTRSFDGARLVYDTQSLNLTAIGTRPTQGGFEVSANRELDAWLAGLAATLKQMPDWMPADARLFYLYYEDQRHSPTKADNRLTLTPAPAVDRKAIAIHTFGGHAIAVIDAGPGRVDGLLWGALQSGDWGSLSHFGWAYAVETGYQLPKLFAAPWLRIGYDRSSGDADPYDKSHKTFFQILPTPRTYAQFPFYNLMNNEDLFAQLVLKPHSMVTIRTDYHWLRLTEPKDLWYSGGGATNNQFFGFQGLNSGGKRNLAHVAEMGVTIAPWKQLTAGAYYAHAFGQGVVKRDFAGTAADYGFIELTARY
ncbi:MAG: alginate export family protein [Deltaproteobacteria bacterium]|nr:alginate export family protein [Deltaproteobacteria bacterium]